MVTATVEHNLLLFCIGFHYLCSMLEHLRFNLVKLCMFPNLRPPASWMGAKKIPSASASVTATAPKAKRQKSLSSEATQQEKPTEKEEEEETKAPKRSMVANNFLNQLKAAKKRVDEGRPNEGDDAKCQVLEKYTKLGKYDEERQAILALWSKDKSTNWWMTYEEQKGSKYTEAVDGFKGFGSRQTFDCLTIVYILH